MKLLEFIQNLIEELISNKQAEISFDWEAYYNNKYPKKNLTYKRLDKIDEYQIDLRQFCNYKNFMLPSFGGTDDEKALKGLKWVIQNIDYKSDKTLYEVNEYWAFNYETLERKFGDCEDGAILLYCILRNSGIPAWKLRLTAGWVQTSSGKGGHAYLTYFCEEKENWVILDWCYWPNTKKMKDRLDYKEESKYLDVWFSWNEEFSWTEGLNKTQEKILNG